MIPSLSNSSLSNPFSSMMSNRSVGPNSIHSGSGSSSTSGPWRYCQVNRCKCVRTRVCVCVCVYVCIVLHVCVRKSVHKIYSLWLLYFTHNIMLHVCMCVSTIYSRSTHTHTHTHTEYLLEGGLPYCIGDTMSAGCALQRTFNGLKLPEC